MFIVFYLRIIHKPWEFFWWWRSFLFFSFRLHFIFTVQNTSILYLFILSHCFQLHHNTLTTYSFSILQQILKIFYLYRWHIIQSFVYFHPKTFFLSHWICFQFSLFFIIIFIIHNLYGIIIFTSWLNMW